MSLATDKTLVTPDQLLAMPDAVGFELIDGELRERNMGSISSYVGGSVYFFLRGYVAAHRLGWVFPADGGFVCFPDAPKTLRRPDASFISRERLDESDIPQGWLRITPDLVVEVVSPHDTAYEVETKVDEFLKVGVPLIWVLIPPTRSIRVHRGDGSFAILRDGEILTGEDVIPGFTCPVADLFDPFPAAGPLPSDR